MLRLLYSKAIPYFYGRCPFCGHNKIWLEEIKRPKIVFAHCWKCMAQGPSGKTRQEAYELWNRRTP